MKQAELLEQKQVFPSLRRQDGTLKTEQELLNEGFVKGSPSPQKQDLVLTAPEPQKINLLQLALQNNAAIDVIERVAALQERTEARLAETDFNQAMNQCQNELKLIVNDADGQKKKYATYKALDREVRPVYLRHGFSLSFGSADCSIPEHILVTCLVSNGMHTRTYQLPMDASGKGPKGEGALSKPHAILAAMEYGRRCLLKSIFNLVTGDEEAKMVLDDDWLAEQIAEINRCETEEGLTAAFTTAANIAINEAEDAKKFKALKKARDTRKKELANGVR